MHHFKYIGNELFCEGVSLASVARRYGTPVYVYSQRTLTEHYRRLATAMAGLDHQICYSVKANSNLALLRVLASLGSGFDIVSGGELRRIIAAGGDPQSCAFAGVGKSEEDIRLALRKGVYAFNVESVAELERINQVAGQMRRRAPIAVRVNPDVDARTHAKITTGTYKNKFGIAFEEVRTVYARASRLPHIRLRGLQTHIGSQLTSVRPFEQAVRKLVPLARDLRDAYGIEFLSIGGGIGIVYQPALASGSADWWRTATGRSMLTPERYARTLTPLLKSLGLRILMEPGRFIAGNAGCLVTRVEYLKRTGRKNFLIVDAAMNDLLRPAMYEAYHEIVPTTRRRGRLQPWDVVGPVCESGDSFCKDRPLPQLDQGDYVAMLSAGAYGSVMSSTYNSRPLAAEVLVWGRKHALVRRRLVVSGIWENERIAPWSK